MKRMALGVCLLAFCAVARAGLYFEVYGTNNVELTNGAQPSASAGTLYPTLPVRSSPITNTFKIYYAWQSTTVAVSLVSGSPHFSMSTQYQGGATYRILDVNVSYDPRSEGVHTGQVRIADSIDTLLVSLQGSSPGVLRTNISPVNAQRAVAASANLTASFTDAINVPSLTNRFRAWGRQSGLHAASFSTNGTAVTLDPATNFQYGEAVCATLARGISNAALQASVTSSWTWSFHTAVGRTGPALFGDSGRRLGTNDARGVTLGDVNSDGWLDLIIANNTNGCEVWTNNGAGVLYDSGQRLQTNPCPKTDVALGDFNDDGDLDAILCSWQKSSEVWTNAGSGRFLSQYSVNSSTGMARKAVIGDFDGDAHLDVVFVNDGQLSRLWRNNGAGTLSGTTQYLGMVTARDAAAGDFNGDGTMDVFILSSTNGVVWTNAGNGAFAAGPTLSTGGTSAAVGDLDGDNDLDLVLAGSNGPVRLYRNNSGAFTNVFSNSITGNVGVVQLGDLDGDGDLDLLCARNDDGESSVWLNDGSGTFAEVPLQTLGVLPTPQRAELGDLDGDGDLDAVFALGTNGVRVFWNTRPEMRAYGTNGVLVANNETPTTAEGTDFGAVTAWSITNTFILTNASPVNMEVTGISTTGVMCSQFQLLDTPTVIGAWSSFPIRVVFEPVAYGTQSAVLAFSGIWTNSPFQLQLQGEYAPPLFVTNKTPANASNPVDRAAAVTVQFSQPVDPATVTTNSFRLWGRNGGPLAGTVSVAGSGLEATFTPAAALPIGDTIFASVADSVTTADGVYRLYPEVWSFITEATNGTGRFYTRRVPTTSTADRSSDVALGDLDGDGDLDAMVCLNATESTQSVIQVFVNDGAGGFTNNNDVILVRSDNGTPRGVDLGDLDGDGDLDAVVGYEKGQQTSKVLWNDGTAHFTVDTNALSVSGGHPIIGDLDGDGDLDLFVLDYESAYGLSSWLNDGAGHFSLGEWVAAAGNYPLATRLGDLDDDGDLDAIVGEVMSPFATYVMVNNGRGGFTKSQTMTNATATYTCELGDVDGDGDLDLVVQSRPSALWLNDGHGVFTRATTFSGAESSTATGALGLGDLDADGDLDTLLVTGSAFAPYEMTNDGYGTFATGSIVCKGTGIYCYATGDLDGNGSLDAFCAGYSGRDHQVLLNLSPTPQVPLTDLALSMAVDQSATCMLGQITFTMTLTNSGPDAATGIQAQNFGVPTNTVRYVSFSGGTYDTNAGLWSVPSLAAGAATSIQVSALLLSTGSIQNVAQVYAENDYDTDSTPGNYPAAEDDWTNSTFWAGAEANDFEVTMTVDNPNPQIGSNVIITVGCTNKGPSDASLGARILVTLAPELQSLSTNGNLIDFGNGVWSMGGGMLYRWLAITARVTTNGVFTNTAQIIFSWRYDPDSVPSNAPPYVEDDDDLVVLRTVSMISASAGPHGAITPTGHVAVAFGENASFVATADSYYWVDSLLTNGSPTPDAAHAHIYTSSWNDVRADGTVSVSFAEAVAALGTPEWWLAQYGWTNDFDIAETNDTDGDSFFAWQEQIAGTDPTVSTSFFQCLEISSTNFPMLGKVLRWTAASGRVYSIDGSTALPAGWFGLASNLPPVGVWTDAMHEADGMIHYRLGVTKP